MQAYFLAWTLAALQLPLATSGRQPPGQAPVGSGTDSLSHGTPRPVPDTPSLVVTDLAIRHVRLVDADSVDGVPTVRVRFDVFNLGPTVLTDVVVKIVLVPARRTITWDPIEDTVAGPITIVSHRLLRPGSQMKFDLRLKNVSSDCHCLPKVTIVSASPADAHAAEPPD
jgi:hypothetical protein